MANMIKKTYLHPEATTSVDLYPYTSSDCILDFSDGVKAVVEPLGYWTESDGVEYVDSNLNNYYTKTATGNLFLKKTDASSIYLSISDASSTYLSQADASSVYLAKDDASDLYSTKEYMQFYVKGQIQSYDSGTIQTKYQTIQKVYDAYDFKCVPFGDVTISEIESEPVKSGSGSGVGNLKIRAYVSDSTTEPCTQKLVLTLDYYGIKKAILTPQAMKFALTSIATKWYIPYFTISDDVVINQIQSMKFNLKDMCVNFLSFSYGGTDKSTNLGYLNGNGLVVPQIAFVSDTAGNITSFKIFGEIIEFDTDHSDDSIDLWSWHAVLELINFD